MRSTRALSSVETMRLFLNFRNYDSEFEYLLVRVWIGKSSRRRYDGSMMEFDSYVYVTNRGKVKTHLHDTFSPEQIAEWWEEMSV